MLVVQIALSALNSERLVIHTNEYEPGGLSGDGHAHSDQEQAFYILEGQMEVEVGDETYQLSSGDCVILPRDVFHKHRNTGDKPLKFLFISAMLGDGPPSGRALEGCITGPNGLEMARVHRTR